MAQTPAGFVYPEAWQDYNRVASAEISPLLSSSAIDGDPAYVNRLNASGGSVVEVPFWNEVAQTDANRDLGDTDTESGVDDITNDKLTALAISDNKTWRAPNFRSTLAGESVMQAILAFTAPYWAKQIQKRAISIMTGVFADNDGAAGAEAGDLTNDTRGAFSASTQFSASGFIAAKLTMGDAMQSTNVIWTHSVVAARMENLQLISFMQGNIPTQVAMWNGHVVIISDAMPWQNTADGADYETWIFRPGALMYAAGNAENPLEFDRKPKAYNGGGSDEITTRMRYIIHPKGYSWTGSLVEGNAPADSVLDDAASWDRKFPERKQIPFARYWTTESAQIA